MPGTKASGIRSTPTQKKLAGNPGRRPIVHGPEVPAIIDDTDTNGILALPPESLGKTGRAEWIRILKLVAPHKQWITQTDLGVYTKCCQLFELTEMLYNDILYFQKIYENLRDDPQPDYDRIFEAKKMQYSAGTKYTQACLQYRNFATNLGMTPVHRASVPTEKEEHNKIKDITNVE